MKVEHAFAQGVSDLIMPAMKEIGRLQRYRVTYTIGRYGDHRHETVVTASKFVEGMAGRFVFVITGRLDKTGRSMFVRTSVAPGNYHRPRQSSIDLTNADAAALIVAAFEFHLKQAVGWVPQ